MSMSGPALRTGTFLAALALGLAGGAPACARLPVLATGTCGNFVIDADEDCDGHAPASGSCADPGSDHACRLLCATKADCPAAYGCGMDGVCRRAPAPDGERLSPLGAPVSFPLLQQLAAADLDANGITEIVVFEAEDALGRRSVRVLAPHPGAEPTIVHLAVTMTAATIGELTGDATDDIAFADAGGVLLLRGDPGLHGALAAYPSIVPPEGTLVRTVPLEVLPDQPGEEIVAFIQRPDKPTLLLRPPGVLPLTVLAVVPGDEDHIAGEVVRARFDESLPCTAIAFAFGGSDRALLFEPCRTSAKGDIEWSAGGHFDELLLPGGEVIGKGLLAGDLDLDGHADLLIGAEGGALLVAWGAGDGTFLSAKEGGAPGVAGPFTLPAAAGPSPGLPLAIADLNADGVIDYVAPTGILVSSASGHVVAFDNLGAPWTVGAVGDLNDNGLLDVAAAAEHGLNIDFLNNAGGSVFNPFILPTDGGVTHLAIGDFDGDLVDDLAVSETIGGGDSEQSHVEVAFGAVSGPPGALVEMASLLHAGKMYAARLPPPNAAYGIAGADKVSDLVVTSKTPATETDRTFELRGSGSRVLTASLSLRSPAANAARPLALATGTFGDPITDVVALAADIVTGSLHLFRIESVYEVKLTETLASVALPGGLRPASPGPLVALHYGALLAAGDLDGDGNAEAVVVAPAGDAPDGAAVVIADYMEDSHQFVPRPASPLQVLLGPGGKIALHDVDGDGLLDAVIVGGSGEGPSELVILWNDGAGGLDTGSPSRFDPGEGVTGATCVPARSGAGCLLYLVTTAHAYRAVAAEDHLLEVTLVPDLPGGIDITSGDFDADGVVDLAIGQASACAIYRRLPEIP